ncbi:Hypothetical predicted protein [Olea europaea subsp. europaea]|uniref:Uncharacterized protein n=1 Tax=Olea europaea subsp. europaea TaxID=158383 RepID=A0A8S0PKG0_OLEEU|nr:Hypothetical predicted protein [Olea europaea subsp. europaea]
MSASSSLSTSSAEEVQGGDGSGGSGGDGFEGPSSSRKRMRSSNGVWPDPFVEAIAFQVAIDASRTIGRLAAAQALFNIFQKACLTSNLVAKQGSPPQFRKMMRMAWLSDKG